MRHPYNCTMSELEIIQAWEREHGHSFTPEWRGETIYNRISAEENAKFYRKRLKEALNTSYGKYSSDKKSNYIFPWGALIVGIGVACALACSVFIFWHWSGLDARCHTKGMESMKIHFSVVCVDEYGLLHTVPK